ncbi:hypothetical protein CFP56_007892 [Quercus suber]|uniref:Uncharacterized protein n=1 Tax=Quercus suber TaxID=58331 RepID=A0AAW0L4S2_QUESU|nr:uncharacterized protein LOC112019827 isoform X1 [Quercus suber]
MPRRNKNKSAIKSSILEDLRLFMIARAAVDDAIENLEGVRGEANEIAARVRAHTVVVFSNPEEANSLAILRDFYGFNGGVTVSRGLSPDEERAAKEAAKNKGFTLKDCIFWEV